MAEEINVKRKPGRPAGMLHGEFIGARVSAENVAALDAYIARQPEPKPSRSEMIRKILEDRLVQEGLIKSDAEIDAEIEDQRTLIADMPALAGRSPEAGTAKMDKAVAENDLIAMKNKRTIRSRGK